MVIVERRSPPKTIEGIGVILAVNNTGGNQIVFRYPAKHQCLERDGSGPFNPRGACPANATIFHAIETDTNLFRPTSKSQSGPQEITVDDVHFIGHPTKIPYPQAYGGERDITFFNVVFATRPKPSGWWGSTERRMPAQSGPVGDMREEPEGGIDLDFVREAGRQLSVLLLHEERQRDFLTRQVSILLKIQDKAVADRESFLASRRNGPGLPGAHHTGSMDPGLGAAGGEAGGSGGGVKAAGEEDWGLLLDHKSRLEAMMKSSLLARNLRDVYHGICRGYMQHVAINNFIPISMNQSPLPPLPKKYQTLLLLEPEADVLESIPADSSPQLRDLVRACHPQRSLEEIAQLMEMTFSQVQRLAQHLVHWGKARVIDTVCSSNMYMVHPNADTSIRSPLCVKLNNAFPRVSLPQMLVLFASGRSFQEILNSEKQKYHLSLHRVLLFLLQHNLLVQLRRFYVLLIPEPEEELRTKDYYWSWGSAHHWSGSSKGAAARGGDSSRVGREGWRGSTSGGCMPPVEGVLAPYEEEWLNKNDDNTPHHKLFRQMCPYFRGHIHLRDLVWRLNISDADMVEKMLVKYKDVLAVMKRP